MILALLVFMLPIRIYAAEDCSARGNVILKLDKYDYQPGEAINGKISIINNFPGDSPITYALKLFRDSNSPWTLIETRTVPPGNSTYYLSQIFRSGIPRDAASGKWAIQLSAIMDSCIWTNTEILGIFSCSDNLLNGDEKGIDCGGSCNKACEVVAATTPIQANPVKDSGQGYIVEYLPFQPGKRFFIYTMLIILLFMIIIGSSIIYWKRRARFSKFY
jgi:hypothetical protein